MISQTSHQAYKEAVQPRIKESHEKILELLRRCSGGLTIKETAGLLGKTPNEISGRFGEMEKLGLIIKGEKRKIGTTNHFVYYLKVEPKIEKNGQTNLF